MNRQKILVCYYSRDGHTRTVAERIADVLNADIQELKEKQSRKGLLGWLILGNDGTRKKCSEILPPEKTPDQYELTVIATPKYMSLAPPIRTYLSEFQNSCKQLACFATTGSTDADSLFEEVQMFCPKPLIATQYITNKDFKDLSIIAAKIDCFISEIRDNKHTSPINEKRTINSK